MMILEGTRNAPSATSLSEEHYPAPEAYQATEEAASPGYVDPARHRNLSLSRSVPKPGVNLTRFRGVFACGLEAHDDIAYRVFLHSPLAGER